MQEESLIFANQRRSASAGTGKTYALASRFIALALSQKVDGDYDPTSIIALTFTRKTAGEFLTSILERVSSACLDDEKLHQLNEDVKQIVGDDVFNDSFAGAISKDEINKLLKSLIRNLSQLKLSTIDAIYNTFLQAFSNELNLFSELQIMNKYQQKKESLSVLDKVFHIANKNIFELLKKASFGLDEKAFTEKLNNLLENSQKLYIANPQKAKWANIEKFLGRSLLKWDIDIYNENLNKLKTLISQSNDEKLKKAFPSTIDFFENSMDMIIAKENTALNNWANQIASSGKIVELECKVSRSKVVLSQEIADLLSILINQLLDRTLKIHNDASLAMYEFLNIYNKIYLKDVISKGKLRFDDVANLLTSLQKGYVKTLFEYRLDSKIKHWLFDEFQDTSRQQWAIFKDLLEDILWNNDQGKSFFYVGDEKQAIYAWRDGDYRLFDEILKKYNISEGKPLDDSYRSSKAIIDLVNKVFYNNTNLSNIFGEVATNNFKKAYRKHSVAKPNINKQSFVELVCVEKASKNIKEENYNEKLRIYEAVFEIIKKIDPNSKGLSAGILLSKNKEIIELVEYLKKRILEENLNLQISADLENHIKENNMIVAIFIQILKRLIHPSDSFAKWYIQNTPLAKFVDNFSAEFINKSLQQITSDGFEAFTNDFVDFLNKENINDDFSKFTNALLMDFAKEFDQNNDYNIDEFINFLNSKSFKTASSENIIEVMTIHKSKGLGFDMVILPDIHNFKINKKNELGYLFEKDDFGVLQKKEIMFMPTKFICSMEDKLMKSNEYAKDELCFEALCKMYVALTRAKTATYIISTQAGKTYSMKDFLEDSFKNLNEEVEICEDNSQTRYSYGQKRWFENLNNAQQTNDKNEIECIANPITINRSLDRNIASNKNIEELNSSENIKNLKFGTTIHKIFEKIYFIEDLKNLKNYDALYINTISKCLNNKEISKFFIKGKNVKIYNEFPITSMYEGKIMNLVIDRLMIYYNDKEDISEIIIIDYKAKYSPNYIHQIQIYKQSISQIFELDMAKIQSKIITYLDQKIYNI